MCGDVSLGALTSRSGPVQCVGSRPNFGDGLPCRPSCRCCCWLLCCRRPVVCGAIVVVVALASTSLAACIMHGSSDVWRTARRQSADQPLEIGKAQFRSFTAVLRAKLCLHRCYCHSRGWRVSISAADIQVPRPVIQTVVGFLYRSELLTNRPRSTFL